MLARGVTPRLEIVPSGDSKRAALAFDIVSAVIDHRPAVAGSELGAIGHLFRLYQVAAADFDAVEVELGRHPVEQSLHHERALRPPGTSCRRGGNEIGQTQRDIEAIVRQHVGTEQIGRRIIGQGDAIGRVSAMIVNQRAANAQQTAVRIGGSGNVPILVALLRGGREVLQPVLDPAHRGTDQHRRRRDRQFLRIEDEFRPEPTADVRGDDTHLGFIEAECLHQKALGLMRHLCAVPNGQHAIRCIEACHHAARFDGMPAALVQMELGIDHIGGSGEGPIDIAILRRHPRDEIVLAIQPRPVGALREAETRIDDGRQRFDLDVYQRQCVLGDGPAVGDHQCDRLSGMAHLIPRQHERVHIEAYGTRWHGERDPVAGQQRAKIGVGEYAMHARQ